MIKLDTLKASSERPWTALHAVHQGLALWIASYPVLLPILEQFTETVTTGLDQLAESLPRVTEILKETGARPDASDRLVRELVAAIPGLDQLLQKADN